MCSDDKDPPAFDFFGFQIERRTNFTSLAAFILSIWAVTQGLYYYLQGSDLHFVQPDRIILFQHNCLTTDRESYLAIVVPITLLNRAKSEYSSILQDVQIQFSLDKKYTYDSESYVNVGWSQPKDNKSGFVACNEDERLIWFIEDVQTVPIEIISGGESFAQHILFVPYEPTCEKGGEQCYRKNYAPLSTALEELDKWSYSTEPFTFLITIAYDDNQEDELYCKMTVNEDVIYSLKEVRYINVPCLGETR